MEIECPECDKICKDLGDILPERACDDTICECPHCEHEFKIGWFAEVEYR